MIPPSRSNSTRCRVVGALFLTAALAACAGDESSNGAADRGVTDTGVTDTGVADPGGADPGGADPGGADPGGADTTPGDAGVAPDDGYSSCEAAAFVGAFTLALEETYTRVQGQIADGVDPATVSDVALSVGACALLTPPRLFCEPGCVGGTTCGPDGVCVTLPSNRDVGEVTIDGLGAEVVMTARAPVWFYNFLGDLPHPAFTSASLVTLAASGGDFAPFQLQAPGVGELHTALSEVPIDAESGAHLTWDAADADASVRVEIELNIANHGGTPGRIVCLVEDTGEFTIPAELVAALLGQGFSGFPSLSMSRQGVGAVDAEQGCVELRLQSVVVLPVAIPGLVSCSTTGDCPDGQTCQPDLTCA